LLNNAGDERLTATLCAAAVAIVTATSLSSELIGDFFFFSLALVIIDAASALVISATVVADTVSVGLKTTNTQFIKKFLLIVPNGLLVSCLNTI